MSNNLNVLVLHHNDPDGELAAHLIWKYGEKAIEELCGLEEGEMYKGWLRGSIDFVPMMYGKPCPKIDEGQPVVLVDFSFKPDEMAVIQDRTNNKFLWIDHHRTAIEAVEEHWEEHGHEREIFGVREVGKSASMLTWEFLVRDPKLDKLYGRAYLRQKEKMTPPLAVSLVNDWDVWKLEMAGTRSFIAGLRANDTSPGGKLWTDMLEGDGGTAILDPYAVVGGMIDEGDIVQKFRERFYYEQGDRIGFDATLKGKKCFVVNAPGMDSEVFGHRIDNYDVCIMFYYTGECTKFHLYSKTVDVSELAKCYGGGGHKGAAGFTMPGLMLPFVEMGGRSQ